MSPNHHPSRAAAGETTPAEPGFTAGPWSTPHFAMPGAGCQCGYVFGGDRMGAIATVHYAGQYAAQSEFPDDNAPVDEATANAHLIAAAPTMYAALLEAESVMMLVEPRSNKAEYLAALGKVSAALRKARGEAT